VTQGFKWRHRNSPNPRRKPKVTNKKCPNCGFINFLAAQSCHKCETDLIDIPEYEQYSYRPAASQAGPYQRPYSATPHKSVGASVSKILLSVFGCFVLISAVAGGLRAVLNNGANAVEWREFRPSQGNYSVMMPAEPHANEPIVTPLAQGSMTNYNFTSIVTGQGSTLYSVVDFPADLPATQYSRDKLLDLELSSILVQNNMIIVSKKSTIIGGNPGVEFEFHLPDNSDIKESRGFGKIFITQKQEYLLVIVAKEGSRLMSGKDKFLNLITKLS
jgi:hypothetical protein